MCFGHWWCWFYRFRHKGSYNTSYKVINFDNLSYAGNEQSCNEIATSDRYKFIKADLRNRSSIEKIFEENRIEMVFNLAAETHVDRSIDNPNIFIETNVLGTLNLLEVTRNNWLGSMLKIILNLFIFQQMKYMVI